MLALHHPSQLTNISFEINVISFILFIGQFCFVYSFRPGVLKHLRGVIVMYLVPVATEKGITYGEE